MYSIKKPKPKQNQNVDDVRVVDKGISLFGDEVIRVESESEQGKFYDVNKTSKTCNCPYFTKRKSMCKHLKSVLGIFEQQRKMIESAKENLGGISKSLLKSALQKSIRRGHLDNSLIIGKALMESDVLDFLRRLAIITAEEAVAHPFFYKITDRIKISSAMSVLEKDEKDLFLSIIADVVECKNREYWDTEHPEKDSLVVGDLDFMEKRLVDAISYRSKIGGMPGDIRMMSFFTRLWTSRFASKNWDMGKLNSCFTFHSINSDKIRKVSKEDISREAVDFHVSPMLKLLLRKEYVVKLIKDNFDIKDAEELELRLKDIMWRCRSSINIRHTISTGKIFNWLDFENEKPYYYKLEYKNKYLSIYDKIKGEMDKIADWFINKQ